LSFKKFQWVRKSGETVLEQETDSLFLSGRLLCTAYLDYVLRTWLSFRNLRQHFYLQPIDLANL
jgi:hypothetical protein